MSDTTKANGWAVFTPSGTMIPRTFSANADDAIQAYLSPKPMHEWTAKERAGFRVMETAAPRPIPA